MILIWLYTNKSGIKTIVWTDALQSFFLITVIVISILTIKNSLNFSFAEMANTVVHHPYARIFDWDMHSGSNFFKQFISGLLITVALVGLDQSMMQKTLTVRNARDARKNVLTFSFFIAFAQTMFLAFGVLIYIYAERNGISLIKQDGQFVNTDELYPLLTLNYFGKIGAVAFLIGVVASTFASIDSCIAALTTAFSYDFMDIENKPHEVKKKIKNTRSDRCKYCNVHNSHVILEQQGSNNKYYFQNCRVYIRSDSWVIPDRTIFKNQIQGKLVPVACISAALLTWLLNGYFIRVFNFDFGFMNIFVNALLTIMFLFIIRKKD